MADLPKNVLAWLPEKASPLMAGIFLASGVKPPQAMWEYRELLADRVTWMLDNSPPEDLELAATKLLENGLLLEPAVEPEELVEAVRAGVLDDRLRVLGVSPPQKGQRAPQERLTEVGLLEWASSLAQEDDGEQPPRRLRSKPSRMPNSTPR